MNIALLGYGKMGKEIEQIALQRKHQIVFVVDVHNSNYKPEELKKADTAIEFSTPKTAVANILKCFETNIPVVVGTTGWHEKFDEIKKICLQKEQALFCAANFSIGVNIFFELNKKLAKLMNPRSEYDVSMEEIHHIQKLDAPSGTAITLSEGIVENLKRKIRWKKNEEERKKEKKVFEEDIVITSVRKDQIPGTHIIKYDSEIDTIEIKHEAKSRKGFALGAVLAAEFLMNKKGVFGMRDLLSQL